MGTQQTTIDHVLGQLSDLSEVAARKMFGEYALYVGPKLVALICDDVVYLKPTEAVHSLLPKAALAPPYPGAKPHLVITETILADPLRFHELVLATANALPVPKPKKPKSPK